MKTVRLISPITRQDVPKKRVAAYCRVSSNSADQLHSYETQLRVYTKLINSNPEWELVEVFADEAISGMKADNRPEFQRMIRMCELHQIDLIITKSVARFARNVKEALEYVRKLKLIGVGVQFEKEGIFTLAMGDEMLLNTFAAIAQEESKAISQNQRLSIIKRMGAGEYVDSNAPYGFRLVNKVLEIYEPEAEVILWIFHSYLSGWSTSEIARELTAIGIPTKTGKEKWTSSKISYILTNERYIGDSKYQKTYRDTTVPFKQFKNRGQEDMYYAAGTHEPIVDEDTFEKVQALLHRRHEQFGKTEGQNVYPLTGLMQCEECGAFYRRKIRNGVVKWVCSRHHEDTTSCRSSYYSEDRIYDCILTVFNKLRFCEENILGQVISKLDVACIEHKRNSKVARHLSQSISEMNAKLLMLEQLRSKGYLAADVYQAQTLELKKQLLKAKADRNDAFESKMLKMKEEVEHLKQLLDELTEPLEVFDPKLFREIVTGLSITNDDKMTVTVLGGLKFTERL